MAGRTEIVKMLLANRADIAAADKQVCRNNRPCKVACSSLPSAGQDNAEAHSASKKSHNQQIVLQAYFLCRKCIIGSCCMQQHGGSMEERCADQYASQNNLDFEVSGLYAGHHSFDLGVYGWSSRRGSGAALSWS